MPRTLVRIILIGTHACTHTSVFFWELLFLFALLRLLVYFLSINNSTAVVVSVFACLVFLVAEYACFSFCFISVLHPSRSVRACNLRKYAHHPVCFLSWFPAFLAELWLFFWDLPFSFVIFSILISIFRRRVVFSHPVFLGSTKLYVVFSVALATCTAYRMYLIRTCADLTFYFRLRGSC